MKMSNVIHTHLSIINKDVQCKKNHIKVFKRKNETSQWCAVNKKMSLHTAWIQCFPTT